MRTELRQEVTRLHRQGWPLTLRTAMEADERLRRHNANHPARTGTLMRRKTQPGQSPEGGPR